jgi:hypothetical protein
MLTARLEIRLPDEGDRGRSVQFFGDRAFMVFSRGSSTMRLRIAGSIGCWSERRTFHSQSSRVIEQSSAIIGYSGVDRFEFER